MKISGVAKLVTDLRSHKNDSIREIATKLRNKWKDELGGQSKKVTTGGDVAVVNTAQQRVINKEDLDLGKSYHVVIRFETDSRSCLMCTL